MCKKKIAFITIRYGEGINGGAEYHCRMLAERLVNDYDVEALTTCVRDYHSGINELPEGEEIIKGVLVRRFKAEPIDEKKHKQHSKEEKPARKWRRFLFRLGLLKHIASLFPVWQYKREAELKAFLSYPFYSPDMRMHIQENKDRYKVFIPFNMAESTTFFAAMDVPKKTILIPTMHNQGIFFKAAQTEVMTKVAYVGFNTESEQRLAENVFGKHLSPHSIISTGIETPKPAPWPETQEKYKLPDNYLLYMGRVDSGKLGDIFSYFTTYKTKHPLSSLHLVLVGGIRYKQKPFQRDDVIYTGFVSDAEKMAILQHAAIVVNPSKFESLSLILLEAMSQEKPVLVNGKCDVLKEHCEKSNFAAFYYKNRKDFVRRLQDMEDSEELRLQMGKKGREYVEQNYNWPLIIKRLTQVIDRF